MADGGMRANDAAALATARREARLAKVLAAAEARADRILAAME